MLRMILVGSLSQNESKFASFYNKNARSGKLFFLHLSLDLTWFSYVLFDYTWVRLNVINYKIDQFCVVSDDEFPHSPMNTSLNSASDSKSMEKLMERSYYKDWKRMGLGTLHKTVNLNASTILSKAESFRISYVNCNYMICRSYPALLVVPNLISEESIKKVARCYRSGRFPVP